VDAAIDNDVQRVVFTSSDKSVEPANTMGATKLLGEKLVAAGNKYSGRSDLRLASVRFGNVLGSSESVIPVFRQQIRNGGPVTLTDERMTRFFITDEQVSSLILEALRATDGAEVFIHEMVAARIEDLAEGMIRVLAPRYGYDTGEIDIEIIGKRKGETLHEKIMSKREADRAVKRDDVYAIPPESGTDDFFAHGGLDGYNGSESIVRSSETAETLGVDEITDLLKRSRVFDV
jgi:FlaA1/EpsC-like NDP-sugar epimerase